MTLLSVSPANAPADNFARINALVDAVNGLSSSVAGFAAAVASDQTAQASMATTLATLVARTDQLSQYLADVTNSLANEEATRASADAQEAGLRVIEQEVRANEDVDLQVQIDTLNQRGNGQDTALGTLRSSLADLGNQVAGLVVVLAKQAAAYQGSLLLYCRPGDDTGAFMTVPAVASLGGDGSAGAAVSASAIAQNADGSVVRVTGTLVLASRFYAAIEAGRLYRARWSAQRFQNPSDPANDAVQFGIAFLDRFLNLLPTAGVAIAREIDTLLSASGVLQASATFGLVASAGISVPAGACYARVFVHTYGTDGVTDVETIGIEDVTDATLLDPVSSDVASRVTTLESLGLGPRTTALEASAGTPTTLTFRSRSEATSGTIPATVNTLTLLGGVTQNDGAGGQFARVGSLPAGADGFTTAAGSTWLRVATAPNVFNATFSALVAGWFATLPTSLPSTAGQPWNNAGELAFS